MSKKRILVAAMLAVSGAGMAFAQGVPTPVMALTLAPSAGGAKLIVTSSAFKDTGEFPTVYTQDGKNISPPLAWTRGPEGTQSYVVLTEDSGVTRPSPIYHWVLYDVPGTVTSLAEGVPTDASPAELAGAMNGLNIMRKSGYVGAKPPAGQMHPYHFEVFALDKKLALDPASANRNTVVDAMKGHVLAEGEIVGLYTGK